MNKAMLGSMLTLATLVLAACGGGGGDSGGSKPKDGDPGLGNSGLTSAGAATGTPRPTAPLPPVAPMPPPVPGSAVPASGSATVGAWSPGVFEWSDGFGKSVLPLHMSLLADGRVMSYGTHDASVDGSLQFLFDVWTPPVGTLSNPEAFSSHLTLPTGLPVHLFCSAQILIPTTGQLLINGGDNWDPVSGGNQNLGTKAISVFEPATNKLAPAGNMNEARWYGSPLTLPNGETYLQGGTDGRVVFGGGAPVISTHAEVRSPNGTIRMLTGFDTVDLANNYPRNFVAPDGKVFGFDHQQMYRIDPFANGGAGSRTDLYNDDWRHGWTAASTAVMFRPGKILQIGGIGGYPGSGFEDGRTATIIDINGAQPALTELPKMSQKRNWATATVLPDGKVVVTGGSEQNVLDQQPAAEDENDPSKWTTGQVAYRAEIYDPVSNTWTLGPAQQRMRLYHSVALLLPNGTVLSAAGGWPGPQLNRNAEIWYPPYLFKSDGSYAPRPTISQAPSIASPMSSLSITSPDAGNVSRVTLVKTGSVTHSFDFEQRFIELPFTRNADSLTAQLPANRFETPPGFYMVFVLDTNGVPSEAKIVRINPA